MDNKEAKHTPTPLTDAERKVIRDRTPVGELDVDKVSAAHARDWFVQTVMSIRWNGFNERRARAVLRDLERLSREENEHAELQSRCFEGFPSVSDGIFDAYKVARNSNNALVAALEAIKAKCAAPTLESDQRDAVHFAYNTADAALKLAKGE